MSVLLVIYGSGGHGREMALAARPREVLFMKEGGTVQGFGTVSIAELPPDSEICVAIGNPELRRSVVAEVASYRPATIVAPTAVIDPSAIIGEGAQICDFSYIGSWARIGRYFQCNVRSQVHHDCVIGDFVTLSPGSICAGNVSIGDYAFVGAGAVIRNGSPSRPLTIGERAVIGMGAVVTKDVLAGATVLGNPAHPVNRDKDPATDQGNV